MGSMTILKDTIFCKGTFFFVAMIKIQTDIYKDQTHILVFLCNIETNH